MKKVFLLTLICCAHWCTAQIIVNQTNLNEGTYQYIEVWEKFNKRTGKFHVMVDYGQDLLSDKDGATLKMYNNNGRQMEFNSVVAILNYFHVNGWELTATKTTDGIESYLLTRRKNFSIPKVEEKASSGETQNQ